MNAPLTQVEYELVLAETFQSSMQKLDSGQQVAVLDAIEKLRKGHASVHVHALPPLPWVAFGANRDALRVICWRESSTLILAWVDLHDPAYRWAERHAPRQFGKVIRIVKTVIEDAPPSMTAQTDIVPPGPLADVRDKVFRAFAVSPGVAAAFRAVPDDDALLELCERLDRPLAEALLALAADPDGIDTTIARYHDAKNATAQPTLADAVKAPINAERIWIAPPDQRAVEAALAGGAATWSVFLHPSQKRLVTTKTSGAYLVTGGPGTGKTVVALHRAKHLAETLAIAEGEKRPVLVTTFSRILTSQLADHLEQLCKDAPTTLARITTLTLVQAATKVLQAAGQPHAVLMGEDIDAAWTEALAKDRVDLGRRFYEAERDDVVLAQGIVTGDAYLRAARMGRKDKLVLAKKKIVWSVLQAFDAALAKRGGDDAGGLARKATQLLREGVIESPFAAVVCDEVQDASRWQLRLLAALATPKGFVDPGADRLFLVGDGHQRLYEKPVSLRACGIEVRGRSARLRLNYRTTQGICAAAIDALAGLDLDVMERDDAEADTSGYRSLRAGARPSAHAFASADDEADFIATTIRSTPARPFLVLARTKTMLAHLADKLRARGVTPLMLGDAEAMPAGDHVVLATLHRSKGLEAPTVVLAGMQDSPLRFPGGSDEDKALHARKERLLVYVGMTRARDACLLTRVAER